MAVKMRTVIECKLAQEAVDQAERLNPMAKQVFDGYLWILSREPETGYQIPGTNYYIYKIDPITDRHIGLLGVYSIGEDDICLESVQFIYGRQYEKAELVQV